MGRPMRAAGSWRPGTPACTPPPWPCWPGNGSGVDRRSGHECVEGGESLHPEAVLLHQEVMPARAHDKMGPRPQPDPEFVDRRRRADLIVAGGDDQYGLADFGRKARLGE